MAGCTVFVSKGAAGYAASGLPHPLAGAAAGMQLSDLWALHVVVMQACSQWTFAPFALLQACNRWTGAPLAAGMQQLDH